MAKVTRGKGINKTKVWALVGVAVAGAAAAVAFYAGMQNSTEEETIIPTGTPTPSPLLSASPLPSEQARSSTITFDGCGEPDKYAGQPWFAKMTAAIKANSALGGNGITELCYAADGQIVAVITGTEYKTNARVGVYNITSGEVVPANRNVKREDPQSMEFRAFEFGQQNGNILTVQAKYGDAGCESIYFFDYNISTSAMALSRWETECMGRAKESGTF